MILKNLLNRIPRPVKAVFCAVCVVVLAIAYYIALGCPTFTFKQEFRRAEKVNLVGPSTIVDTLGREYSEFDKMIVGETQYSVCFFGRYYNSSPYNDPFAEKQYLFTYVEKTGDLTISAAPNIRTHFWVTPGYEQSLPVYLFVEEQDAIRAEVEITVAGAFNYYNDNKTVKSRFKRTFVGNATRSDTGVFEFWFSADDQHGLAALAHLSTATGGSVYGHITDDTSILAKVRLYDQEKNLILEKELTIGRNN